MTYELTTIHMFNHVGEPYTITVPQQRAMLLALAKGHCDVDLMGSPVLDCRWITAHKLRNNGLFEHAKNDYGYNNSRKQLLTAKGRGIAQSIADHIKWG